MLWLSVSLEEMYKYGDIHQQEAAIRGVLLEKLFLEISQKFTENICQSLFFNKVADLRPQACNFIKKETLTQVFSCGFCEISKVVFFLRVPNCHFRV